MKEISPFCDCAKSQINAEDYFLTVAIQLCFEARNLRE